MTTTRILTMFLMLLGGFCAHAQSLGKVISAPGTHPQIIVHSNYTSAFNPDTKTPDWVSWSIEKDELKVSVSRKGYSFAADPSLKGTAVTPMDYSRSGYDRGHMCPAADNRFSHEAMTESFYMTNICPQNHTLNEKSWSYLESACRDWAQSGTVYVVCGPFHNGMARERIGWNRVAVPEGFWKVVLRYYKGSWRAIGFYMANTDISGDISLYVRSVDEIEEMTGMDFFSELPDEIENTIESAYDLSFWPHARH